MKPLEVEQIVSQLESRVADRRATGDYPPGLEQQLEAHFAQMLRSLHHTHLATERLASEIDRIGEVISTLGTDVGRSSRLPAGALVHGVTASLVRRHTQLVVGQVGALGSAIQAALNEVRAVIEKQQLSDDRETAVILSSVMDRLAVIDHLAELVTDLEERVRRLERGNDR